MPTPMKEHRKFFERPEEPRPMRVTARDIAIMQNIGRLDWRRRCSLPSWMAEARRMSLVRSLRCLRMDMSSGRSHKWRPVCCIRDPDRGLRADAQGCTPLRRSRVPRSTQSLGWYRQGAGSWVAIYRADGIDHGIFRCIGNGCANTAGFAQFEPCRNLGGRAAAKASGKFGLKRPFDLMGSCGEMRSYRTRCSAFDSTMRKRAISSLRSIAEKCLSTVPRSLSNLLCKKDADILRSKQTAAVHARSGC